MAFCLSAGSKHLSSNGSRRLGTCQQGIYQLGTCQLGWSILPVELEQWLGVDTCHVAVGNLAQFTGASIRWNLVCCGG
jgi:hypothetical protein